MPSTVPEILAYLKSKGNPGNVAGMARYGIIAKHVYGAPTPVMTALARSIGRDHKLATGLWKTRVFDARVLAIFVEEPERITERQMERWVRDFDNWAICDGVCLHLFDRTPFAYRKAIAWSARKEEFVRRAGFVMMAVLASHDKEAADEKFHRFLKIVKKKATDERNYVKKGVNWALRGIGKRNLALNQVAIRTAKEITRLDSSAARWIARDALRELQSVAVQERLRKKAALKNRGMRQINKDARLSV
ncbi:MAG: DNA alkylation repair protein, partial [Proteobacteria bacterium]|nr:DNA alkylation repair protein [Pseudomonadota bacterium]